MRTLGTLLKNVVPLLTAISIGRNVLLNRSLAGDVAAAAEEVKNSVGLSAALAKGKRFPRLALQMIQVGEESGALDTMLLKTADTFEQETGQALDRMLRSEEHTSELQSLMRISYAVFCLKKKKNKHTLPRHERTICNMYIK